MQTKSTDLRAWTVQDAEDLYQVRSWGNGYFSADPRGELRVHPDGRDSPGISLKSLADDLVKRGHQMPMLLRFSDILRQRVVKLTDSFAHASAEYGYRGGYRPVYPIKVNQQRDVVEELVEFGRGHNLGLEAGSKPELLIALAHMDNPDGLIICNGFKDTAYIETVLIAQKLGRHAIIVIDRFEEIDTVIDVSRRLEMRPHLGIRARLAARGAGKWMESTGDRSKFGLSAAELVRTVDRLREEDMLDCLELLHFHIGSQITSIRSVKDAMREASRIYLGLYELGAGLGFLDVGGGLAVDYDGSKTNFHSSSNYTLQEYANDVVWAIQEACDTKGVPHPDIISESGRALTAHHTVLLVDVLGRSTPTSSEVPDGASTHTAPVIVALYEALSEVNRKNFQETFHDALGLKEEATSLFQLGYLDLKARAIAEQLFWAISRRIERIVNDLEYVPEELERLTRALADTYYCNFSVFQSIPDHWAVKQLFPTMPIHRLNERPKRRAVLADLTCDSDGRVDQFIDLRDVKHTLELHDLEPQQPDHLGMFLVGAYQEILGDLHNLFGDTLAVHVSIQGENSYEIERVVEGDTVTEVLGYVQYGREDLIRRVRRAAEAGVRNGSLRLEESALLLRRYTESLTGYTYLSPDALA